MTSGNGHAGDRPGSRAAQPRRAVRRAAGARRPGGPNRPREVDSVAAAAGTRAPPAGLSRRGRRLPARSAVRLVRNAARAGRRAHPTRPADPRASSAAATGETVNLAVVRGNAVVQVAQVDSTLHARRDELGRGRRTAPLLGARQGLLRRTAPSPSRTRDAQPLTRNTITEPGGASPASSAGSASRATPSTRGELEIGLDAVAAPVYDRGGGSRRGHRRLRPSDRVEPSALPAARRRSLTDPGTVAVGPARPPRHERRAPHDARRDPAVAVRRDAGRQRAGGPRPDQLRPRASA